jgi:hypothetical protein
VSEDRVLKSLYLGRSLPSPLASFEGLRLLAGRPEAAETRCVMGRPTLCVAVAAEPAIHRTRQFPVASYLVSGKSPDKGYLVIQPGSTRHLIRKPHPAKPVSVFPRLQPRRLGAYLPERKPRFP